MDGFQYQNKIFSTRGSPVLPKGLGARSVWVVNDNYSPKIDALYASLDARNEVLQCWSVYFHVGSNGNASLERKAPKYAPKYANKVNKGNEVAGN